jgi:hypothetical protein
MSQPQATLQLDAEQLYAVLLKGVQRIATPEMALVGVWSGGASAVTSLEQRRTAASHRPCTAMTSRAVAWPCRVTPRICPSRSKAATSS